MKTSSPKCTPPCNTIHVCFCNVSYIFLHVGLGKSSLKASCVRGPYGHTFLFATTEKTGSTPATFVKALTSKEKEIAQKIFSGLDIYSITFFQLFPIRSGDMNMDGVECKRVLLVALQRECFTEMSDFWITEMLHIVVVLQLVQDATTHSCRRAALRLLRRVHLSPKCFVCLQDQQQIKEPIVKCLLPLGDDLLLVSQQLPSNFQC